MNIKDFITKYVSNLVTVIGCAIVILICLACAGCFIAGLLALANGVFMWYLPISIVVLILIITLIMTLGE